MTPEETRTVLEAIQRSNRILIQTLFAFAGVSDHLNSAGPGDMVTLRLGDRDVGALPVALFRCAAQHSGWLDRHHESKVDNVHTTP